MVDLSKLNISMDITPDKGVGLSSDEAFAINASLSMHKIQLDPTLVGGYQLLNITLFKPPISSQGTCFWLYFTPDVQIIFSSTG